MAESIYNHLNDDGMLVVIDSWSDFRILVVGRAFEQKGLLIKSLNKVQKIIRSTEQDQA